MRLRVAASLLVLSACSLQPGADVGPCDGDGSCHEETDAGSNARGICDVTIDVDGGSFGDEGTASLGIEPQAVDYGYRPVGSEHTKTIRITNQTAGNDVLHVVAVYLSGDRASFDTPDNVELSITPATPFLLPPCGPNDPSTVLEVPVTLRPSSEQTYTAILHVEAHNGDPASVAEVAVELTASSLGP